jgi:hypothetical protein
MAEAAPCRRRRHCCLSIAVVAGCKVLGRRVDLLVHFGRQGPSLEIKIPISGPLLLVQNKSDNASLDRATRFCRWFLSRFIILKQPRAWQAEPRTVTSVSVALMMMAYTYRRAAASAHVFDPLSSSALLSPRRQ